MENISPFFHVSINQPLYIYIFIYIMLYIICYMLYIFEYDQSDVDFVDWLYVHR